MQWLKIVAGHVDVHAVLGGLRIGARADHEPLEERPGDPARRPSAPAVGREPAPEQPGPPRRQGTRVVRTQDQLVEPLVGWFGPDERPELPAVRVDRHGPRQGVVELRGAELHEFGAESGVDVQVQAVLHGLRFGNRVDPHLVLWVRTREAHQRGAVRVALESQRRRPEPARSRPGSPASRQRSLYAANGPVVVIERQRCRPEVRAACGSARSGRSAAAACVRCPWGTVPRSP
jgi:hypothetical protein